MAYKYREEIVGKRFLSVSGYTKIKLSKISEWGWRAGVIRAASHKDNRHPDLQVLVEYDDVEWHRREWISIYKDRLFYLFLVEDTLVWTNREDPFTADRGKSKVLWPALSFTPLVDTLDMETELRPVEFLVDRELVFRDFTQCQPFQEWDPKLPGVRDYPELRSAVRKWAEYQDGQRILLTTPSVLVGYRVEVYRAEGTTQWYTAVIVGYNEATRDLTVTDDTVLEEHNEDPSLVQMRLIGDGVVESIMRGENVGITPRRSRSAVLTQHQPSRIPRNTSLGAAGNSRAGTPVNRKPRATKLPVGDQASTQENNKDKSERLGSKTRQDRKRKSSGENYSRTPQQAKPKNKKAIRRTTPDPERPQEDVENKVKSAKKKLAEVVTLNASSKKILEEANSKLRRVQIRVEDCLQVRTFAALKKKDTNAGDSDLVVVVKHTERESTTPVPVVPERTEDPSDAAPVVPERTEDPSDERAKSPVQEEERSTCSSDAKQEVVAVEESERKEVPAQETSGASENEKVGVLDSVPDKSDGVGDASTSESPVPAEEEPEGECTEEPKADAQESVKEEAEEAPEEESKCDCVSAEECKEEERTEERLSPTAQDGPSSPRMEGDTALRFPDDRSDSGVSSLRGDGARSSGDERSGSRSSALSDERSGSRPSASEEQQQHQRSPFVLDKQEPVRVWRDPSLLVGEPHVRHIHSVQHQTLMSHPPTSVYSGSGPAPAPGAPHPAPALTQAPLSLSHYPPTLLNPHPLSSMHPGGPLGIHGPLYPQLPEMLWKQRYHPPLPVGTHLIPGHPAEELLERERDRQERLIRERREQEIREIEKQQLQKEREMMERERIEREKKERDIERERQEQDNREKRAAEMAVHKHFEESLRLAQQKQQQHQQQQHRSQNMGCWNLISSLPPPRGVHEPEEERKRAEQEQQQHRMLAERQRHEARERERVYHAAAAAAQQRPPSGPNKVEYPPPPAAHSRGKSSEKPGHPSLPSGHTALPKAEPNFSLFGYPGYQPVNFLAAEKLKSEMKVSPLVGKAGDLPNPPPLMSDLKNSVIVKNEGKNPHDKVPAHSVSPKLRITDGAPHYLPPTSSSQPKPYEYRSPSQSPQTGAHPHTPSPHHNVHMEPQNLAKSLTRPSQMSPHRNPSPAHNLPPSSHPSPPERTGYSGNIPFVNAASSKVAVSYPYSSLQPGLVTTTHFALTTGGNVVGVNPSMTTKPKVSSPAPPHMYGRPTLPTPGITTGTPVCRTEVGNTCPLPLTSKASYPAPVTVSRSSMSTTFPGPPPAHSSNRGHQESRSVDLHSYDHRLYQVPHGASGGGPPALVKPQTPQGSQMRSSPSPGVASTPPHSRSSPLAARLPMPSSPSSSYLSMGGTFQTQPLDLGVSDRSREDSSSPKRKGSAVAEINLGKKRRTDLGTVPSHQNAITQPQQPLLARVSEPSPLIASAATTITTVVNTAAYCTPSVAIVQQDLMTHVSPSTTPLRISTADTVQRPSSTDGSGSFPVIQRNPSPFQKAATPPGMVVASTTSSASTVTTNTSVSVSTSPTQTTAKPPPPSSVDSEKSNSPGPSKSVTSSYPVHKLKKAWLERHSGEDGTKKSSGSENHVKTSIPASVQSTPVTLSSSTSSVSKEGANSGTPSPANSSNGTVVKGKPIVVSKVNRKSPKESGVTLNGHATDISKTPDDSSSSDQERKSPTKTKRPKVKKKKSMKKAEELAKRKKANSESQSDSDKESGSEKDSDSGASTGAGTSHSSKKGGSKDGKEPRKRGRRPKSKNEREEPRQKKPKEDPPQRDPFRKPPVNQLKKTGESFLQDGPCFEVAPKLAKCRECRWTPNQRSKNMPNIFCRFYAFRRLRYTKNGQLAIAGFSDPHKDAAEDDLKLWLPMPDKPPTDLDADMSRFLLAQVGDQFCDLLEQEKESVAVHMSEDKTIAWKRVVQGVREMCDVCETTLFNFHWACGKCGFVVCIDCYKGRKNGTIKVWGEAGKDRDEFSWLFCTNRQPHEQEKLMLTQIIAGDSLLDLGRKVHEVRFALNIPQYCGCTMSKDLKQKGTNGICKDLLKNIIKLEPPNGMVKQEKKGKSSEERNGSTNGTTVKNEDKNSPLSWLADVALSSEDKKPSEESGTDSDSDDEKDGNYSTLRELLIRPSHKTGGGSGTPSPSNSVQQTTTQQSTQSTSSGGSGKTTGNKKSRTLDTLDKVISSVIEDSVQQEDQKVQAPLELKHFIRRTEYRHRGREPLPIRIMTLTEGKALYPDVPHSWLCDGKLLRLHDSIHSGNYRIFQDQWKRGQPILVSEVTKGLDMTLWHPDSFARDFGEDKNDLVNCMTGNLVPKQPMKKFWEGFEQLSRRLKDDKGNPMLLKLKDWPPGEDFAEMLPSRFNDLMKVLPLGEYTNRTGRLNLASRLPDCFVRPDLGPKMYNAYGSALYPNKGTTNLHLDISDAVNVMVYVGIPKDSDNEEHIKEALKAVDEAGCDILTRRRVREKGELPGALWHIYGARDADKIRDLLNKVALENGNRLEPHHDPIHDQSWYLDEVLRERLYKEYGVECYAIVQCLGDAVFIPAGAPHQVRNLHNCIKVAEDFVSPENVSHCFHLTQEFRDLSDTHSNHEDKLQIKNIIYHAVKDSLSVLMGQDNDEAGSSSSSSSSSGGSSSSSSGSGNAASPSIGATTEIKKEMT